MSKAKEGIKAFDRFKAELEAIHGKEENTMISVIVLINGQPITGRSAYNTGKTIPEGGDGTKMIVYQIDDGSTVLHNPEEGAVKLAVKLLNTIKEV